jgi:hypothetical protein
MDTQQRSSNGIPNPYQTTPSKGTTRETPTRLDGT